MLRDAIKRRADWITKLDELSGSFSDDTLSMVNALGNEITSEGPTAVLEHLRLCGAMPEKYGRDSTEEKLYSKYTDALISESLNSIGLQSAVIESRADAADVQARANDYSLVADAKAFRLSRTAKNQKDFKIQALDEWRYDLDFAVVIGPIYQFPTRASQIYRQAIARNVCVLSYSHLAVLTGLAIRKDKPVAEYALGEVLKTVSLLHPSKSAADYWVGINRSLIELLGEDDDLWTLEKIASEEALRVAKDESLRSLRAERDRLLGLSHRVALKELIRMTGIDSRIAQIQRVKHGELLGD